MVFKLWLIMMGIVILAVTFIWFGLIFFLEQNYAKSAQEQSKILMQPIIESLQSGNSEENDQLLPLLSRMANGIVFLVDPEGDLILAYNYGHLVSKEDAPELAMIDNIQQSSEFDHALTRTPYEKIVTSRGLVFPIKDPIVQIESGYPILYDGMEAYLIISQVVNLKTTLATNRRQLTMLSLLLTVSAAALAAIFSRYFTKPICQIKDSIDRLAKNDYSAVPDLKRSDEIGELSDSVTILSHSLQRVDRLGKELIANISHELRSPLSIISGYAEMVRDIHWKYDDKREEDLNLIIQESRRLTEMVNDILDYSQLQAGCIQLRRDAVDLHQLTEQEIQHCIAPAAEHDIHLEFHSIGSKCSGEAESFEHSESSAPSETIIFADALKMSQVLRNLLYNAINHTPSHGTIHLYLTEKDGKIRLSVCNPGDPIPEEDRAIIWERYKRSQHHSGRKLGTGIGLSIVSSILTAHQMEYGVECKDGYTIFWFECRKTTYDSH